METFETFKEHLQEALNHLYDPAYHPAESVWTVTGIPPQQGTEAVGVAIRRAIGALQPAPDVPSGARIRRIHQLLDDRYVQGLTQAETAARLNITPRHLRREQKEAVQVLAERMWDQAHTHPLASAAASPPPEPPPTGGQLPRWRSQMRQELSALHKSAPGTIADVAQAIRGVVELESTVAAQHDIQLRGERAPAELYAAMHPSALRQLLIAAIGQLTQRMGTGRITLQAERKPGKLLVTISGEPVMADAPVQQDLFQEILAAQGGTVGVHQEGERLSFRIELAPAQQVNVLVIDDNLDLVHFYRRYTAGTRYTITHVAQGGRAFEAIRSSLPHIIVLDVMLPDVDGWELLVHLHESPETRQIPIVVCSVIRELELALALGAALYLPKPVRRRQFVEALDRVLAQSPAATPTGTANSARSAPRSIPGPS